LENLDIIGAAILRASAETEIGKGVVVHWRRHDIRSDFDVGIAADAASVIIL
jgi:hypothetical protein